MLNDGQKRFIAEYIIDCNASAAYLRAGYSSRNPDVQAARFMANPEVKAAIAKLQKKVMDKLEITAERVLRELAVCGFVNMDDFVEDDGEGSLRLALGKTTRAQRAAIAEITEDTTGGTGDGERKLVVRTKIKFWDKQKSLELLGKHLKLYTDKVEHSANESLAGILAFQRRFKDGDSRS